MPDPAYFQAAMVAQLLLLLLIPLEILLASRARIRAEYDMNDTLANVAVSVGSIFFWGTLSWMLFSAVTFAYGRRIYDVPFAAWSFLLAFVLEDFRYYWWHRIGHRSRWFWASHVVHHVRGPEPAGAVADSMPPVIAEILQHEGEQKRPRGKGNVVDAAAVGEGDGAEQHPAERAPEEYAADADCNVCQRVVHVVLGADSCAGGEQYLERNEQQQQQLRDHRRLEIGRIRHAGRSGEGRRRRARRAAPSTPRAPRGRRSESAPWASRNPRTRRRAHRAGCASPT